MNFLTKVGPLRWVQAVFTKYISAKITNFYLKNEPVNLSNVFRSSHLQSHMWALSGKLPRPQQVQMNGQESSKSNKNKDKNWKEQLANCNFILSIENKFHICHFFFHIEISHLFIKNWFFRAPVDIETLAIGFDRGIVTYRGFFVCGPIRTIMVSFDAPRWAESYDTKIILLASIWRKL